MVLVTENFMDASKSECSPMSRRVLGGRGMRKIKVIWNHLRVLGGAMGFYGLRFLEDLIGLERVQKICKVLWKTFGGRKP